LEGFINSNLTHGKYSIPPFLSLLFQLILLMKFGDGFFNDGNGDFYGNNMQSNSYTGGAK
jgi:hypothetical protein